MVPSLRSDKSSFWVQWVLVQGLTSPSLGSDESQSTVSNVHIQDQISPHPEPKKILVKGLVSPSPVYNRSQDSRV